MSLLVGSLLFAGLSAPAVACEHSITEESVKYSNGSIELAAALVEPADTGTEKVPGLVLLQGSGTSDRNNGWARAFAEDLASCGIAVLLTDKRGSGQSEGDWETATFVDLALDGVAGLEFLETQANVDIDRTGFLGLSQGGMIAPLAARLSPKTDMVIGVSGGVIDLETALRYELEQTLKSKNIPSPIKHKLDRVTDLSFEYIKSYSSWDRYLAARQELIDGEWDSAVESWPTSQSDTYWDFWRKNYHYDSAVHWRSAAVEHDLPTLLILGDEDRFDNLDVDTTAGRYTEAVQGAAKAKLIIYDEVGHLIVKKGAGKLMPEMIQQIASLAIRPNKT